MSIQWFPGHMTSARKKAAETMARFCSCGIFNTTRARRILEDVRVGVK